MSHSAISVLFLVPYPLKRAPSQRFRVEQFLPILENAGIRYRVEPFLADQDWAALYRSNSLFKKVWYLSAGFLRRFKLILRAPRSYQYIFIHREATSVGPPLVEWVLAKLWRKKIIYDFDDAIWMPDPSNFNRARWFKNYGKVAKICGWSSVVVGGNSFLCDYAKKYAKSVVLIPTVIDENWGGGLMKIHSDRRPVVGWTGSRTTLFYLNSLLPILQRLEKELAFDFLVIADQDSELPLSNYRFIQWSKETEAADLIQLDIGVMPLTNNSWSEGKCGFKLIQYYAVGIPAIADAVGVNKAIIQDGETGFLCAGVEDWESSLRKLISSVELRASMGKKGQAVVQEFYSVRTQKDRFLALFDRM